MVDDSALVRIDASTDDGWEYVLTLCEDSVNKPTECHRCDIHYFEMIWQER